MKKQSKLGFSLIELSVVILVIGILVIGITQGSRIISEAKIKSVLAITRSSPVNSINGLTLWLDATDSSNIDSGSIGSGTYGNVGDGSLVSNWRENNAQSNTNLILSAPADDNRPTYIKNGISGLPSLRFSSASTTALFVDGFDFPKADYSIFAVFKTSVDGTNRAIISFVKNANNPGLNFHLQNTGEMRALHRTPSGTSGGNTLVTSSGAVQLNRNYITSFVRNFSTNTSNFWLNNSNVQTGSETLGNFESAGNRLVVGSIYGTGVFTNYFEGDISEIIVFDRALKNNEKQAVEQYLSQKYSVKLS
jgi:prepilin-type N-terminal cleavage/methylation domain-containing protein